MYTGAFDSPGPGPWELEQTHFTRPMTRWMQAVFPGAQMRGMREAFSRYGALVDTVETLPVQGFAYGRIRPLGAPPDSKGHPPRLVMKALFVLHPEMRRRVHRCADAFERKLWREDMARWDGEWRPEAERQNAALAAVEPSALDDDALRAHLRDARTRLEHAMYRHHSLNVTCGLPVGDFIAHAAAWTGKPLSSLLGLLTGSSPVSVGAAEEMTRLVCALRAAPDAAALFASDDDAAATLERLRTWTGEVGAAARAYLDKVGLRLLSGYDVGDYYALEVPIVLVRAIRASLENAALPQTNRAAERLAEIRDAVPADRRADFDALLEEARFVNRLRDERGYLNDAPASGIARRALLEAGRRLADRGRLHATDHALDLSPEEVDALLAGLAGPSADDIAAASHWRATKTHADAPARLGPEPAAPPPVEWLPPASARAMRAINALFAAMFDVRENKARPQAGAIVSGFAASPGRIDGIARLVVRPEHFQKVQKGDILVAAMTCPSYNVLLPILGAIVTDRGGLLSHAAIVAREYGLPAVVGTRDATRMIPDGARVRVDGGAGTVEILG